MAAGKYFPSVVLSGIELKDRHGIYNPSDEFIQVETNAKFAPVDPCGSCLTGMRGGDAEGCVLCNSMEVSQEFSVGCKWHIHHDGCVGWVKLKRDNNWSSVK